MQFSPLFEVVHQNRSSSVLPLYLSFLSSSFSFLSFLLYQIFLLSFFYLSFMLIFLLFILFFFFSYTFFFSLFCLIFLFFVVLFRPVGILFLFELPVVFSFSFLVIVVAFFLIFFLLLFLEGRRRPGAGSARRWPPQPPDRWPRVRQAAVPPRPR